MTQYIDKDTLVAEIERISNEFEYLCNSYDEGTGFQHALTLVKESLDTLEVKEVDEQKERMNNCPFRKVGCAMYEGRILECKGACSWVVDYPKLKELNTQKIE